MSDDDRKAAAEAALDLLLYAPLGFALEARSLLPRFVERGKNQVTMARMVGQFAVQQGQVEATKRLGPVQEQVETLLADLGVVPRPTPPASPDVADDDAAPPTSARADEIEVIEVVVEDEPAAPSDPVPAVDALAIPDYDSLAASQVVPRLRALSGEELEAVRAYEAAGRGRKTILNRVAQLQSGA